MMIELAKHIERLLLENDCVIVPDFGGFIAHYEPSRYVADERLFLPPVRTVGFNPQLTLNDGLLVQSYMQAYQTDFPDATRIISEAVSQWKENLYREGLTEIHGIGVLRYNIHGQYEFQPNGDGVISPALYGLHSFSMSRLDQLQPAPAPAVASEAEEAPAGKVVKMRTLRPMHRWIGNVAAVAIAVVAFFFLSVPVENTYVDKGNYASLGTDGLFDAIRSQSLATTVSLPEKQKASSKKKKTIKNNQNTLKPVAVKVEKVAQTTAAPSAADGEKPKAHEAPKAKETQASAPVAQAHAAQAPAASAPATHQQGRYCIIVASLANATDAAQVVGDFQKKGFSNAEVIEGSGRFRVSIARYADKGEAYQQLNELRKDETMKNAWLLNSK